ncbi:mechanosensitive ion channel family protein [Kutzneria sp. 744]|uniref:mechanosensitive ion channel family protein n=1 Tax=Kutzneria sp. (strain 744) TaxID=345341 RepID=UPI0003EED075|nr:small conductance mechanosensitive ion channel protein MscS [Kutzneria sp. 744]
MTGQDNNVVKAAGWFADNWPLLVTGAIQVAIIVVLAVVIRLVLHRMIDKFTQGNGEMPPLLRPLKERVQQLPAPQRSERRRQRAATIGSVLKSLTSLLIYGIAFLTIMKQLGFDITPIIASAGVLGVAIGFGAQSLVRDFLSGVFMMLEDQYGVGDVIDAGQATGTVEAVGLRVSWQAWLVLVTDIDIRFSQGSKPMYYVLKRRGIVRRKVESGYPIFHN